MKTSVPFFSALFVLTFGAGTVHAADPAPAAPAVAADKAAAATVVEITVNDSAMKYSVVKIDAHPGQVLTVRLRNNGTQPKDVMGHNWILFKAGVDIDTYTAAASSAKAEGFQPKALADQVIASIPLLGPKQSGEVTFTCPKAPGTYDFICSFPAHNLLGMKGVLIVK